ncbi:DUF2459 domain-containing protein [Enterovirga rhinocerotis]|uniref:Uncharacterized protein (TIGR02117 family) n=1 Tax=Enterovirga rhinocerotis TaxID=1339210 RepID=A0A4R7C521_9HYPH|nr:DUF2459 domain-containing protein [Enterovirga rhinocerotis]TDR93261.1 uncharacterized protein (TIGR02117 family) [Enterovirga rhinocerotis]
MRWALRVFAVLAVAFGLLAVLTIRFGDRALYPPRPGEGAVTIHLVSNGYHTGLVLPRQQVSEIAGREGRALLATVAARFAHYDWIETGWGEDAFYREVPTVAALNWRLALRALFRPGNASVMHVVGIEGDPLAPYRDEDTRRIVLSEAGFARLLAGIDASFARGGDGAPEVLGQGLYGPSLFYRAVGAFSLASLCNHWTARRLNEAGLPVWLLPATLPRGMLLDLDWRAGTRSSAT